MKTQPKDAIETSVASAAAIIAIIPELRAYARSRLGTADRAEDAVQDTLERAWRSRQTFAAGSSLKGWLVRIMRNLLIDQYRKHHRLVEDIDGKAAALLSVPAVQHVRLEYGDLLSAIETLSPDMRQALLFIGLGMTHVEASVAMGIPLGTLKSHVRRGRARIEAAGIAEQLS